MLEILTTGKLVGAPEQRTAKSGKTYVTAKLRVAAGAEETHFVRITCFSESACTALLALAAAGSLKVGVWTPQGGEPRPNLDMVVGQVMTIYGLARKRAAAAAAQPGGDEGPGHPTAAPSNRPARRQAPVQRSLDAEDAFGDAGDDGWLAGGAL